MKPIDIGLETGDIVLLDSGPLIYYLEKATASRRAVSAAFLEAAATGSLRLIASTLVWAEVLRGPLSRSDGAAALAVRALLSDSRLIRLEAPDVAVADIAASQAAEGLSLVDALHFATAIVHGAKAVLTNDEDFRTMRDKKKGGRGLPRVLLVDELAFDLGAF